MTSISSVELNYLVFRYLQESGFTHSAFALGYEAGIDKCTIDGNLVPPGALVKFIQKGLQYLEMEANLSNSDTDVDEDFSLLHPLDLITKDVHELRRIIKEKKKSLKRDKDRHTNLAREREGERGRVKEKDRQDREKEHEKDREKDRKKIEKDVEREKQHDDHNDKEMFTYQEDKVIKNEEDGISREEPQPMDTAMASTSHTYEISGSDVTILKGHTSEICACAWSPAGSLLASGSGDSTARIWTITDPASRPQNDLWNVKVLKHVKTKPNEKNDVTALDWNGEGTLLATGSYDGQARIWNTSGELISTLCKHKGPIFSLKWNKKGDYLLSGSCDKTAVVWDVKAEEWKQQFDFHSGATLDVDWRSNSSFATSSSDALIFVCKIGEKRPLKRFSGHQGEVNCVKWDPTGSLLASCSDDVTAKIWSMKQDNYVHDLKEHTKEIYTIRWSPTGPGTNNPNLPLVLASASFDSTVKLWEVEQGKLLCSLNGHREPVYSLAFSPTAEYLASGSLDKSLHIWSLKERKIVKTYTGSGGIFEVCWNKEGDKIAACSADSTVSVLDFRM